MKVVVRILDKKTGLYIDVMNVPKDFSSLDKTEGILIELNETLEKESMDTPNLVKKAWKSGG